MSDSENPFGSITEEEFQNQLDTEGKKAIGKSRRTKEREAKAAAKAEAQAARGEAPVVDKTPAAPPEPKFCLCGCGAVRGVKAFFIPGHDSTAKSFLLKVDRGQVAIPEEGINQELLDYAMSKWAHKLPDLMSRLDGTYVEPEPEPVPDEESTQDDDTQQDEGTTEELPEGDGTPQAELDPNFEGYPGSNQ